MPKDPPPVLTSPTLLQEGPQWLVLVPAYGGAVQTYTCDTELRARALLKLFERTTERAAGTAGPSGIRR